MAEGWIKLHRQLQDCPIWFSERFSKGQAWVDLLMMANHSSKKILFNGQMITVQRGQMITSMVKLSEKWKWDRKTVLSFLKLLESEEMISRISDNSKTIITIENYDFFQGSDETVGQPIPHRLDSKTDTNKNDKNGNNKCTRKKNQFNNFSQRDYDFDKVEKDLLYK